MDAPSVEGGPHGYAPLTRSACGAAPAPLLRQRRWLVGAAVAALCLTAVGAAMFIERRKVLLNSRVAGETLRADEEGAPAGESSGGPAVDLPPRDVLAVVPPGDPATAAVAEHVAPLPEPPAVALPVAVPASPTVPAAQAPEPAVSSAVEPPPVVDALPPEPQTADPIAPAGSAVGCAKPGEGCQHSQCCIGEGFQCFEKDANWADCMYRCSKDGWSCKELGMRTPLKHAGCAEPPDNCALSTCCKAEGHQCYEKDESWATCKLSCSSKSGWSCKKIGERQPFRNPPQCGGFNENCVMSKCCKDEGAQCYAMDENFGTCSFACKPGVGWSANWSCDALGERAPSKLGCSWSGQACTATKKCCHEGQQCVKKNDLESYCTHEGPGEGWDGTVVGGARSEFAVQPVPPEEARGTSLFCFMAVLPGSSEEALVSNAEAKSASIFACDAHALFHSWETERTSEGSWNSVVNTEVFVKVWRQVEEDGQYRDKDWTVKVDADSVFFPDRLREHLQRLNAPTNFPIYIKNTDLDFGFLGAIEVFSKEALDKYFEDGNDQHCLTEIGSHSGEDGFMKGCMDMLGAGYFLDVDVLRTPATKDCTDNSRVTFHAFKDVGAWEGCFGAAQR